MTNLTNYHSHCLYCDGRANMEDFILYFLWHFFSCPVAVLYCMDNGMGSDG